MKKKSVLLIIVSVFLLSKMLEMQLVTSVLADSEINEPVYSMIAEYYDNRKAVVTLTADDWTGLHEQAFEDMCSMLTNKKIYHTGGIITNQNPNWIQIQHWLDEGYTEAASHSRTHSRIPYEDYDSEIGGSKDDIISNLTLSPNFSFDGDEYVYAWIEPFGDSNDIVRQTLASRKYLADREVGSADGWATWDSTNGLFKRIGYSIRMGSDGTEEITTLNNKFESVYNAGGIYHLMCHPISVNWQAGGYADSHTDYISNRNDVWYVSFGLLYLYRWIATQNVVEITSVGSGQGKAFKISISSANRQDYGARYPVTYVFNIPSGWTSGYVYYRYQESDPWVLMENKSSTDFFNGINASRFDFTSHTAYVSVGFGDISNDIYLQIRSTQIVVAKKPPVASFTYSPSEPFEGEGVTFNASASYDLDGTIQSYAWDLGDGTSDSGMVVTHVYPVGRTYTVTLTVTDDDGLTDSATASLTIPPLLVNDVAVIGVTVFPTSVKVGNPVSINVTVSNQGAFSETFNVTVYYDLVVIDTRMDVSLGTGSTTTLTFTWDTKGVAAGTYTLSAEASVVPGETDTADNTYIDGTIKIASPSPPPLPPPPPRNKRPKADFTYSPSAPTDMDTIRFTDESRDPDGSIASWLWDFSDGSTTTEKNPTHQYADNGNYTVTLTVRDNDGAKDEITKQIIVLNVPPKADFTIISPPKPRQPKPQDITQFMDQSLDPDGSIVSWRWEFGDRTTSTHQNPTHKYEILGTYTIKLVVTDDDGATDTTSKIYDSLPPTSINDYDGLWHTEDFTITLTVKDDHSGVQAIYYRINDGPIENIQVDGQPNITAEGSNKLEYWSVDGAGNEETHHIIDVKLDKTAPVADAGIDQSVTQNIPVTLNASESSDNVGVVGYEWNFGDGSEGTDLTTTHTYKETGIYVVRLTVKDAADNKNISLASVTVLKDTDGDGKPDATDTDDDGDEMPDAWELSHGLDPLDATDAALDPDVDGSPNLEEWQQGTDPTSYFSPFPWWIFVLVAAFGTIFIIISRYAIAPP